MTDLLTPSPRHPGSLQCRLSVRVCDRGAAGVWESHGGVVRAPAGQSIPPLVLLVTPTAEHVRLWDQYDLPFGFRVA